MQCGAVLEILVGFKVDLSWIDALVLLWIACEGVFFIYETYTDVVREAMGKAGAGKIGKYRKMAFDVYSLENI